ncbi:ATP-binding protein [Streptomyces sp. RerS4]|nr:ATP-binding protein [Streptomyces sp. RerS4]UQX05073.1 ATP-binding protein [Streptomyces sp. RerS4]
MLGPPGVGETHIAVALSVAACRAGFSVYFTTLDDMVRPLKVAEGAGRLNSKLRTYLRPGVLVVDEVGYQPSNALRRTWCSSCSPSTTKRALSS